MRAKDGWTQRHGDFEVPRGRIAALVGPNGEGKTSLLALAAGLSKPTEGTLRVLGQRPGSPGVLPRVGVLLQDRPLHGALTVAETLRLGRELNPAWDDAEALSLLREADIPLRARVGRLSGGRRTCLALAMALGKRPDLLLLDEPMADLDPLRRHTMMAALMRTAAEHGTTVVMSSHILAELHLVCDYVLLTARGRMLIADDTDFVQAAHTLVTYARDAPDAGTPHPFGPDGATVIETRRSGRSAATLLRLPSSLPPAVRTTPPALDEILLAYLRSPDATPLLAPTREAGPGGTSHSRPTTDGSGA
ncbi:ATP-binding cassette domain-containing protein [Streptomyces sp. SPB074]|uniref:ATP-binding cassette domain-containing protein n=1 Tax=Streptomyces sp. (strain SPB074) TaxID=465543 RepID=UPI0001D1DC27|nr:vegetative cell wall protein gp1 [Streptomyces sp. SPB074]